MKHLILILILLASPVSLFARQRGLLTPLQDSTAGQWNILEGKGDITHDLTANNNHGSLEGGVVWADSPMESMLDFDGSSGYINVPHSASIAVTGAMTIIMWINLDTEGDWRTITCKGSAVARDASYGIQRTGGNIIRYFTGGGSVPLDTTYTVSAGVWYNITVTRSEENLVHIYIDGIERASGTPDTPASNTKALTIGARDEGTTQYFDGQITNTIIYNRDMSSGEVIYNFNLQAPLFGKELAQ